MLVAPGVHVGQAVQRLPGKFPGVDPGHMPFPPILHYPATNTSAFLRLWEEPSDWPACVALHRFVRAVLETATCTTQCARVSKAATQVTHLGK
jgi:hypothetical protein